MIEKKKKNSDFKNDLKTRLDIWSEATVKPYIIIVARRSRIDRYLLTFFFFFPSNG